MAAKTKCPACGAKNPADNYRCRICTAIINPDAAAPVVEEQPVTPLGIDHFDAGEIDRQIRPARERFGSTGGALAARIAAAQGNSPDGPAAEPSSEAPLPDVAAIEFEHEPFDPDALFRDLG